MKKINFTTAHRSIMGDLHTPLTTYLKLRDEFAQSVLMESADYHDGDNNRSFIGLCPIASFSVNHNKVMLKHKGATTETKYLSPQYTVDVALSEFMNRFQIEGEEYAQVGLFGFTTFNAVRYFEEIPVPDSFDAKNDVPDIHYILYKYIITFDNVKNEMKLMELLTENEDEQLDVLEHLIQRNQFPLYNFRAVGETTSTLTDEEHRENIRKGIMHCQKGDVFQIVLSRRFIQRYAGDDFQLYRALRNINPSPYLFYFDFGGYRIFGSSPETHCRIEGEQVFIDPIAGTAKHTGDKKTDALLSQQLRDDPKENEEHVMLVDLARNDLSRNCHDVKIQFFKETQHYSHVTHLVSRVKGTLNTQANPIKTFIDTFPAGTLSGAPKVRAMQLINKYEPHNRGAYGGCIGFIGFNGDQNQAITIRTFVSRNHELWFQAGGGIVAKSNVENELQEVNNKLRALKRAIVLAEKI